jgi:hypothetical protein
MTCNLDEDELPDKQLGGDALAHPCGQSLCLAGEMELDRRGIHNIADRDLVRPGVQPSITLCIN